MFLVVCCRYHKYDSSCGREILAARHSYGGWLVRRQNGSEGIAGTFVDYRCQLFLTGATFVQLIDVLPHSPGRECLGKLQLRREQSNK